MFRWFPRFLVPPSTITRSRRRLYSIVTILLSSIAGVAQAAPGLVSAQRADAGAETRVADRGKLPDPNTVEEVTLDAMLAFADARSPVLVVARSTRSRAEAMRAAAAPLLPANPELSVAAGPRYGITGTGVDVDVAVSQRIRIAGERGLRRRAADRFTDLTEAEIEQFRWAVHCDVHAAFHRAIVARERALLADHILVFQEDLFQVVQKQTSAGETAPLALRLAQAEVAQARQGSVAAAQVSLAARLRLAQLSGWPVDRPPVPKGGLDLPRQPPALETLMNTAYAQLPLLRTRAAAIREAEARIAVAKREIWPQPSLGVQYRREGNPTAEGPYNIVMGTLSLSIPSFQTNQADRARARADLTVAQAERSSAEVLLVGQIAEARSEVVAAAERIRSYGTDVLPRFQENLQLLRRSFTLGEIDMLSLSMGRERFLRIQNDGLDAHLAYFVALATLERMVGADLWRDESHQETKR